MEMIRAQEQTRDLHEQFQHQLQCSQDGFSVIAEYFGRGIFNKVGEFRNQQQTPYKQSDRNLSSPQLLATPNGTLSWVSFHQGDGVVLLAAISWQI